MSSYSKTMDDVLQALYHGEDISILNGQAVRSTTMDALEVRGAIAIKNGIPELTERGKSRVAVSIGENLEDHRPNRLAFRWIDRHHVATFDVGQCDYTWWDKARRGAVAGLEIGGLFIKPLASKKAAWVLGQAPQFSFGDDEKQKSSNEFMNDWFREHHTDILLAMEESAVMGDYFIVINPDESLTVVPPNVVEPIVNPNDYSEQIGWRVTQVYSHPQTPWFTQTIIDEMTFQKRTRTIFDQSGTRKTETYKNLVGLLPIIHIPNNRRGGELFGHPESEALVQLLHYYSEVIDAAVLGNIRQGRPTPTFESLGSQDNLDRFVESFGQERTRLLPNGELESYTEIVFSSDMVVYLGEAGKFRYAQPGSFTGDTMNITQLLYYLMIEHTEIPEFVWGGAIQGSQASANTQMGPMVKWAEKEQGRAEKWLIPLVIYITALRSLYDSEVKYSPDLKLSTKWAPLSDADGQLTLEAIKVALTMGGWEPEDVIPFMPLDIDNPDEIIQKILNKKAEAQRLANGDNEPFVNDPDNTNSNANPDADDDTTNSDNPEAEIVRAARKTLSEANSGVMVAFEIPLDIAANLASAARQSGLDAVAPEDMHITLAYLGDMADIEDERDLLLDALQEFANDTDALSGVIGGIGRFNASENSGGQDVLYASVDAPDLPEFRQSLVRYIEAPNLKVARNHGFTPHITLAYINKDDVMPNLALETTGLTFTKITLYWGDERTEFQLTTKEREPMLV